MRRSRRPPRVGWGDRIERNDHSSPKQDERPDAGEILQMISDKRVSKKINVEEIKDWEKRDHKIRGGEKYRPQSAVAFHHNTISPLRANVGK